MYLSALVKFNDLFMYKAVQETNIIRINAKHKNKEKT